MLPIANPRLIIVEIIPIHAKSVPLFKVFPAFVSRLCELCARFKETRALS